MPAIYEAHDSPQLSPSEGGQSGSARVAYNILDASTPIIARQLVVTLAPLTVILGDELLVRQTIEIAPDGPDIWKALVSYGPEQHPKSRERPQPGTWKFSFSTKGGRNRVTKSLETISRHWIAAKDDPAPNLKGAIEYDGERVNGVEIYVPNLSFDITAYYDPPDVTTEFMRDLARATPRYNSDNWLGFDPGEVLFIGSTGDGDIPLVSGQRVAPIAVTHSFECSENVVNLDAQFDEGSPQVSIDAKGFEYVWYRFKKDHNDTQPLMTPRHAYVERLYKPLAFGPFFGFGT
jgi:hypothetical protein